MCLAAEGEPGSPTPLIVSPAGECPAGLPFDGLCRLARSLLQVPAASLCLTGDRGHWLDVAEGLDAGAWHFATSLNGRPDSGAGVMVVEDVAANPVFAPWAHGLPGVTLRFIASLPLPGGAGRLAVFDVRPRGLDAVERGRLADLVELASAGLRLIDQAEQAAMRENHFRLLAETSTDTIVRGNLDGVRLYVSPSVRTLIGYEPEELVGRRAMEIVHPDDLTTFAALMGQIRSGQLSIGVVEVRQRHKDGSWVWMEASVRLTYDPLTREPDGYVSSVRDIGRRKLAEQRLEHLASHDALTELPNRTLFNARLDALCASKGDAPSQFAVFCIDIDHFKQVNDTLGHQAGDSVLREAARRFRSVAEAGDLVARTGGDEFALIMPVAGDIAAVAARAGRILTAMQPPFVFGESTLSIGVSIGIALAPHDGADPDRLASAADRALYEAKSAGRNGYRLSTPSPLRG
ncbi:diguanylate cyclase (GGDEF)-like protein/PAS domain S-box-containing protein [Angulomicrobium tetraedrale]|uniref:Diguanylate cyclase (GGDEF)-like protein/PAS domain S-box-containing protein n=1 Tax=Ancylobacter tetraedralis TaxID=217068 RepID=A0A839Z858_9HYPH|nr:GGDEF domain-containing protein [Ancylobacter tetraedralis]MBB3769507.1 diguanylate cyclase (GGDEF)-like protein/PAS domain S-box-containing protein [Ancylobacter tetraedralis]